MWFVIKNFVIKNSEFLTKSGEFKYYFQGEIVADEILFDSKDHAIALVSSLMRVARRSLTSVNKLCKYRVIPMVIGRANGRYFTEKCSRNLFCNHNPLDTRIVQITDYIHKGNSVLNPPLQVVVEDDLLYGFGIACPLNQNG